MISEALEGVLVVASLAVFVFLIGAFHRKERKKYIVFFILGLCILAFGIALDCITLASIGVFYIILYLIHIKDWGKSRIWRKFNEKKKKILNTIMVIVGSIILLSLFILCLIYHHPTITGIGIANPASVYCEQHGGTVDIRTSDDGSQLGYCVFSSGNECEEWAFYRGECSSA